jgi:plasmid stabilization system protein ParE
LKVIWSPLAIERAYEEASYIAQDKPEAALNWLHHLFSSTDRLERFPLSGRIVPEVGLNEYREIIYKSHRVIYRVDKASVAILTVRRASRLLDREEVIIDDQSTSR